MSMPIFWEVYENIKLSCAEFAQIMVKVKKICQSTTTFLSTVLVVVTHKKIFQFYLSNSIFWDDGNLRPVLVL